MPTLQIPSGTRLLVAKRDGPWCSRCSVVLANVPSSIHHRFPRRMGGSRDPRINDPRNLILICGTGTTGCHGWIESNRDRSRELGWLIASLDDAELDAPMLTIYGTGIRLFADGRRDDRWPYDDTTPGVE